ncbi:CDKN2AIP N-terminal-like protein [Poeciliopsis prolifica]|uniref:CDKN2AIP N-terminal-like protein n=1 Tax=Poeciliopsis prolifica TaxID=188132 RepID=UPI0024135495|nr:CDKN2AIP N-terminal-like protein [Poeciliopsis prolifica]
MSALAVQDFIQQNRATAQQVETFRGYWESDKHWEARREFILRNMSDFEADRLDHLLSLSMVWANNVFMGCRYSTALLDKVKEMAAASWWRTHPFSRPEMKSSKVSRADDRDRADNRESLKCLPTWTKFLWFLQVFKNHVKKRQNLLGVGASHFIDFTRNAPI